MRLRLLELLGSGAAGEDPAPGEGRGRDLGERLRELRRAYLQVVGMPDYETYLAHRERTHPGEPVLSRGEFCARAIERRYDLSGPRCC